jgi:hypothetical protein
LRVVIQGFVARLWGAVQSFGVKPHAALHQPGQLRASNAQRARAICTRAESDNETPSVGSAGLMRRR